MHCMSSRAQNVMLLSSLKGYDCHVHIDMRCDCQKSCVTLLMPSKWQPMIMLRSVGGWAGSSPAEQHSAYTGVGWLTGASQHQDGGNATSSSLRRIDTVMGSSLPSFGQGPGSFGQGPGSSGNPLHQQLDCPDLSTLKEHGFKTVHYSLWRRACLAERTSLGISHRPIPESSS